MLATGSRSRTGCSGSLLDVVRERATHLGHKPSLVLWVSQVARRELRGAKIQVRTGELRALTHGVLGTNRLIADNMGGRGSLLKKLAFLNDPPIAEDVNGLRLKVSLGIPLGLT